MKSIFLLLAFITTTTFSYSQTDWEKTTERDGVSLYLKDYPGSGIKQVKAIKTFNTTLDKMEKVLTDIDGYEKWAYNYNNTKILKTENGAIYYHTEIETPWPLDNRDVIIKFTITKSDGKLQTKSSAVTGVIPEEDNFIRMTHYEGSWEMVQKGDKVETTMIIHAEPGGDMPEWLINMFLEDGPIDSLLKFGKLVEGK